MHTATAVKSCLSQTIFKGSVMFPENIISPKEKVKARTPAAVQLCASVHHVVQSSSGRCPYVREIITVWRGQSVWTGGLGWCGATEHQTGWQDSLVKLCCVAQDTFWLSLYRLRAAAVSRMDMFLIFTGYQLSVQYVQMFRIFGHFCFFGLLGWQCRSASLSTTLVQSEISQRVWMDSDEVWYRHSWFPFDESY